MEEEKYCWVYINKHVDRKSDTEVIGGLELVVINDLVWELNYRGDSPLLIYRTNGSIHILQIDGDLFYPIKADLSDLEDDEVEFDAYLFTIEEALKFLNFILYEDLELEIDEDAEEESGDNYYVNYNGENVAAFEKVNAKIENQEEITEEDLELLIENN